MGFTREQTRSAYQSLSPDTQDFVHSNATGELIMQLLVGTGLSEAEAQGSPDSEILHAMYGLQTLDDAIANIAQSVNKSPDDLSRLKYVLDEFVFSKIPR